MATAIQLEAELAGEERALRHLIGERAALTSQIKRTQASEKLLSAQLHAITTRNHPAVSSGPTVPHGDRFPDVSSFQPNVDWPAVRRAASVRVGRLAVTKVTEGLSWVDHFGALRLREMAGQGFEHRGAYHFLHPSEDPIAQAHHFLEAMHAGGVVVRPSDILVCDAEVSDGQSGAVVRDGVKRFGEELRRQAPAKLWLYSGGPFVREYGIELAPYDAHWLPAYVGDPRPFMVWGARTIAWQYTDGRFGPVPHVCPGVGSCDLSIIL